MQMEMTLESVYTRLQEKKTKRRVMVKAFKDELAQNTRYQQVCEEIEKLRGEKKSIENMARVPADVDELETLKCDIKSDQELLTDITLNKFLANETVEIVDDYHAKHIPKFSVRFTKS